MDTATIREKLQAYIQGADDKKVAAIYTLLEGEIAGDVHWWEQESLVQELEEEYHLAAKGQATLFSKDQVANALDHLRKK